MSDIYQATYDVVSRKIGYFDAGELIDRINCNFSNIDQYFRNAVDGLSYELTRPCILYRVIPFKDGNKWCALLGENIQDGICGFGNSPYLALKEFDSAFYKES